MKKILLIIAFIFLFPFHVLASGDVNVYIFHQYTCSHCQEALEYFQNEDKKDPHLHLYEYEILKDEHAFNRLLYNEVCQLLEIKVSSVPLIIIGNDYFIGFSDSRKETLNKTIDFYKQHDYADLVGQKIGVVDESNNQIIHYEEKEYTVDTIFGTINLKNLSLPLITIIIGFIDGFNPCAMWVLLFLISMLLNMQNKKKMWILGLTFIGTSGFIYFLFMMAWLNVNSFINEVHTLQIIVGLFAMIFGLTNLYRFIKERKEDGCVVIKKEKRKFVFTKIKNIVENKSFTLAIIGIITLAIIINLIELLCSLGLPMMYTEILSLNNLGTNAYIRYIMLYIFFFIIDDIVVFVISMLTLKSTAISTKYNKYSHLIGGLLMLIIGLLIILKPEWLAFNFK